MITSRESVKEDHLGTYLTGASWLMLSSSASNLGEIVSRSQPASANTWEKRTLRLELYVLYSCPHLSSVSKAGAHDDSLVVVLLIVVVDLPHTQHTRVLLGLVGLGMLCLEKKKSAFDYDLEEFTLYQSMIRPTNGEMRVTLASAQATAWKEIWV